MVIDMCYISLFVVGLAARPRDGNVGLLVGPPLWSRLKIHFQLLVKCLESYWIDCYEIFDIHGGWIVIMLVLPLLFIKSHCEVNICGVGWNGSATIRWSVMKHLAQELGMNCNNVNITFWQADVGLDHFWNFPKPIIWDSLPLHSRIGQLCGGGNADRVWTSLSSSLFLFFFFLREIKFSTVSQDTIHSSVSSCTLICL